eukprot:4081033-Prymnesium_polylepis.1
MILATSKRRLLWNGHAAVAVATTLALLLWPRSTSSSLSHISPRPWHVPSADIGTGMSAWTGALRVSTAWRWYGPRSGQFWIGNYGSTEFVASTSFNLQPHQARANLLTTAFP